MPSISDAMVDTCQTANAVRDGAYKLMVSDEKTVKPPGAQEMAQAAYEGAGRAAVLIVRQVAVMHGYRPYQGDTFIRMAEGAAQRASDFLAAAWAIVDRTPHQELTADVLNILVRYGWYSVNDGRYLNERAPAAAKEAVTAA